jgi:hypothetical protein
MGEISDDEFKALIMRIRDFYSENDNPANIGRVFPTGLVHNENGTYTYTIGNRVLSIDSSKSAILRDIISNIRDEAIEDFTHGGKRRKAKKSRKSKKSRKNKRKKSRRR